MSALHRLVHRSLAKPGEPARQLMRPRRQRPPGTGAGQLVRAKLGQRGEQRRGLRQHDLGEGLHQRGQRGAIGPADPLALERILPARINGGKQHARVDEEIQRLPAGQPPTDIRQQIVRARLARAHRPRLPPLPGPPGFRPSTVRASSALGHGRQHIGAAGPVHTSDPRQHGVCRQPGHRPYALAASRPETGHAPLADPARLSAQISA